MARRRNRGKKNQEDEVLVDIIEAREQAQDFWSDNQNLVLGGLLAVVLVVGGIFAYNNFYKEPMVKEAIAQSRQAQFQFERDSFALALSSPGAGYPGFLEIIDKYGATNTGNLANYYAGISYLNLGDYDNAIKYLGDFSPSGDIVPAMKYGAMGDAYSEKGDMSNARSQYKSAIGVNEVDVLTSYYLKKLGMLEENQGNYAAAKEAYQRIKSEFPLSPDGSDIDRFLARVEGK